MEAPPAPGKMVWPGLVYDDAHAAIRFLAEAFGFEQRLFERAPAAGAELVQGLREEDSGSLGFSVRDPEGNIWSFGSYRGAGPG
jgi:uncharacterized glyoxalase superfamily protein PhnB